MNPATVRAPRRVLRHVGDALDFYQREPVAYVEDIILRGVTDTPRKERLEPMQADVLAFVAEHRRVALRAANGVGKDALTAWIVEWFLVCHAKARIPIFSPSGRQVTRTIFAEIAGWTGQSLAAPKLDLTLNNILRHRAAPQEWWAIGVSPRQEKDDPTGMIEGIHAEHLLVVITEAKAVQTGVWDAAKRMATRDENRIFCQSVPGPESGEFYACFTSRRATWKSYSFPSARKVDLDPGNPERGHRWEPTTWLVSPQSILDKLAEGEDSPNFRAGVLAEFLRQGSTALIPLADILAAQARARPEAPGDRLELGVDVARFGDDLSCFAPKRGPRILPLLIYPGVDTMELAGLVVEWVARNRRVTRASAGAHEDATYEACTVRVDVIGLGAGVYDRLVELQNERAPLRPGEAPPGRNQRGRPLRPWLADLDLLPVNVGAGPSDPTRHAVFRDEVWDVVAELLHRGDLDLPDDPQLVEELTTCEYKFTSSGQKKIEPKDAHKRRLGRSPDRADAVCLAVGGVLAGSYGITI